MAPSLRSDDPFSFIPPAQLHTMREAFSVLDHSSKGFIRRKDVADMLRQMNMDASESALDRLFGPGQQELNLAAYLSVLATPLRNLSDQSELRDALSAFDEDDCGQVDAAELRDALLATVPEPGERNLTGPEIDAVMGAFTGRRAFTKSRGFASVGAAAAEKKKGEVFKYLDFVNAIHGVGNSSTSAQGTS